jgi:hypothetical protein
MRRFFAPALLATLVVVGILAASSWAAPLQQVAKCSSNPCTYMPVVVKPENTPLATEPPTLPPSGPTLTVPSGTTPRPTNTPTATPTLPPPTFNNCQADPNPNAAPNYPVRIVSIDKVAEVVTLQNVSTSAVSLDGWHMCSITGNQEQQGIGGTLAPGETKGFTNPGGPIWNNSTSDPGALYNQSGQLVSYWFD